MSDALDVLREDPVMAELIEEHGVIRVEPAEDSFERFVTSIVNQQLSGASAAAIRERLFDRFEVTPDALLAADEDALRETGLSRQKVSYLKSAAAYFQERDVSPAAYADMPDEAVIAELEQVRGVGAWTAKMFLMFVLGREDVFPVEDLGIRKAMQQRYGIDDRAAMQDEAERWKPFRSVASRYLWRSVD